MCRPLTAGGLSSSRVQPSALAREAAPDRQPQALGDQVLISFIWSWKKTCLHYEQLGHSGRLRNGRRSLQAVQVTGVVGGCRQISFCIQPCGCACTQTGLCDLGYVPALCIFSLLCTRTGTHREGRGRRRERALSATRVLAGRTVLCGY